MYKAKDFANMSEKEIRNFMVNEHAYLEEDVVEYDRQFMIEILLNIPEMD